MAATEQGVRACFHGNLKSSTFLNRAQVELEVCDCVYDMAGDLGRPINTLVLGHKRSFFPKLLKKKEGIDLKDQVQATGSKVRLADRIAYAMWLIDDPGYGPDPTLLCAFRGTATLEDWLSNFLFHKKAAGDDGQQEAFLKQDLKKTTWSAQETRNGTQAQGLEIHAGIFLEIGIHGTGSLWDVVEETYATKAREYACKGKRLALVLAGKFETPSHVEHKVLRSMEPKELKDELYRNLCQSLILLPVAHAVWYRS